MHPEIEELRPKLKEILYDCAVEIRATKAALYLLDPQSNRFELVTEYGFRNTTRQWADENDVLIDRCGRARTPFFVNGVGAEPRLSELLFSSGTDRLLAAPLYSRGKLIGVVDMRDKAGKAPFEQADVPKAQAIGERMVALFANMNVFGHRFIALSRMSGEHTVPEDLTGTPTISAEPPVRERPNVAPPPPPAAAPPLAAPAAASSSASAAAAAAPRPVPPPREAPVRAHVPRLATLVIDARAAASSILVAPAPESIGESELAAVREVLRSILLIPGAVTATFSAYPASVQETAARATLTEDAQRLIQSKLNVWLTKRGDAGGFVRTSVQTPFGTSGAPVVPNDIQKVFTAPLQVGSLRGLYLTVAFAGNPDRVAHELLAVLHAHLQLVIEQSMQRGTMASFRARAAEKLVEPDFAKYPELRRHTDAVAKLAESFARALALSPHEAENARLVAIVHDCGMRLLDYERLYRKKDLTQEELGFLREHVSVGAALVEPLLGGEIARAVLCHHERADGRGYPNEIAGDEIPLLARVVQLCDAWVAMTDPDTYQTPESPDAALAAISRAAGSQFDAELVPRFVEMIRSAR
ncbi:MAG TPA: HD domain-containing phosphohydrolase [Thermoanaerobaculia bacterium]